MSTESTCSENVSTGAGYIDMTFDPRRPFNDLPNLPPASETETKAILRSCIAARTALAELRVSGKLIPNQAMLINSIPLLEAQASSEIENIVTTTDRLFRYANDAAGQADPATKEALRYRTALYRGYEMLKRRPVSRVPIVRARLRARGQPRPRVRPDRPTPPRPQAACPPPELLRRRLLGKV